MLRTILFMLVILALTSAAIAVPSHFFRVGEGVLEVRDDTGGWGGMTNGITHMSTGDYTARKILDTSDIPAATWDAASDVRLSVYFMVRDYSWHDLPAVNGLDESYQIVINGNIHEYPTNGGAPIFAENSAPSIAWYDFVIPKSEFIHGVNEILVRKTPGCKGDDYLYLGIDNSEKRGNSSVAFDGKTWTQEMLTIPGGNGEYLIRLYVLEKPTSFEARWRPDKSSATDDPCGFFIYTGGRDLKPQSDGLSLAAGQSARVEWAAENLDMLQPVTATVEATGTVKIQWINRDGTAAKDIPASMGVDINLPAMRSFQPSGLLITATDTPVVVQSVKVTGSRSYHPLPPAINLTPAVKVVKAPPALQPVCKINDREITLAGGQLRAKFQSSNRLRLTSLYNMVTRTEMIHDPAACALFLVEVNGKRYSGSREFKITSIKPSTNGFVAQLDMSSPALRGLLTVNMTNEGLRMGFSLTNTGKQSTDFKLAFPHLASLAISPQIKDDYYFFPAGGGIIADTSASIRRGYGEYEALYQVMDLYSPALGGGLSIRTDDKNGWHKILALRKHIPGAFDSNQEELTMLVKPEYKCEPAALDIVDGTAFTYEYLRRTRKPGASFTPATAVLTAHTGDWHSAMADYAKWAHSVWKFRPYPSKLKSVRNMMATGWATDYLFKDGKYRTDFIQPNTDCIELMSWWDWSPLGPFGTPFDQLEKVLSPAKTKEWEPYFVNDPVTGKKMWNNQPGDYLGYNERFGGLPAFQAAIKKYKSMGSLTTLYTDFFRMDFTSKIGLAHGKEWGVINKDDKLSTEYDVYNPCHDLPEVREWVAKTTGRVMRETGADGIRLDEYGHRGWACYNPSHKHSYAEFGVTQWNKAVSETIKMVHRGMDKVRPGLVLTTEFPAFDYMMQYLDGCITYDLTGQKSPLRPLECNLQRFYFPECKAYELDHMNVDVNSHKKFWNAVESFGRYYPDNMYTILNENENVYQGRDNYALLPTLQNYLYCNRFRGEGKTIYHLYNAMGHTFEGEALKLDTSLRDTHVVNLLTCQELPVIYGKVSLYMERNDVACVAVLSKTISMKRSGNALQVSMKSPGKVSELVISDVNGKQLLKQKAKAGAQTLDLTGLLNPVCVKLLNNGQLVDAVGIVE